MDPSINENRRPLSDAAVRWIRRSLDLVYPPQCLSCGTSVTEIGTLCGDCWVEVRFIGKPHCRICGTPFAYDLGPAAVCGSCAQARPTYDRARAVMIYNDRSRELILAFKHGDRTERAPALAAWLVQAGAEMLGDADIVAPVPLHWTRSFSRRYNQAALLAKIVAQRSETAFAPEILVRQRRTPSQGRLNASARRRNVQGAFAVRQRMRTQIQGRRILLVDDVFTTGATVTACTTALRRAGAGAVDVLTLAKVVRSDE